MPSVDPLSHCNRSARLTDVQAGEEGVVERLDLEADERFRLMRLGLVPGRRVNLVKRGSRFLLATAGARLAIDRALAAHVYIIRSQDIA